jgi:hypothetical protein
VAYGDRGGADKMKAASAYAAALSLLLMAEAQLPTAITSSQAIAIAAQGACGSQKSDPKTWDTRLEGKFWRVWTPKATNPDALSNFVFAQVYVDAKTGKVDHCTMRAE